MCVPWVKTCGDQVTISSLLATISSLLECKLGSDHLLIKWRQQPQKFNSHFSHAQLTNQRASFLFQYDIFGKTMDDKGPLNCGSITFFHKFNDPLSSMVMANMACLLCWPCLLPRQGYCVQIHYRVQQLKGFWPLGSRSIFV